MFNFSALFNSKGNEDETEGPSIPQFSDRWKWFSIIERLAGGDVTKFNEVYKITYITALNTLSYWQERDEYQERLRKRNEMISRHK